MVCNRNIVNKKWILSVVALIAFSFGCLTTYYFGTKLFGTFQYNSYISEILISVRFHQNYLERFLIRDDQEMKVALHNDIEYNLNYLLGNLQDCIDNKKLACSPRIIHESKNALKSITELRAKINKMDNK